MLFPVRPVRSLVSGKSGALWRTGILELIGQTAAEPACLGKDFLSGMLIKSQHQFLMLKWAQVGHIVLVKNEHYRSGWPKHIHDSGTGFDIEFLATNP